MDEIRKIIKAAERQNWRVVWTTKGYIAKLRRHGLLWPPRT